MMDVKAHQEEISEEMSLAAWIGLFLGPVCLLFCLLTQAPAGMTNEAWHTVGITLLMAIWWATEAIPIPATSLLPVLLVPMLHIGSLKSATTPYGSPTVFLFMGGFILGLAMQRWNLHKRIALLTLRMMGSKPKNQIAGFMMATAFISMWVSNTATTIMMLPIGLSIIGLVAGEDRGTENERERFATALLLGIAYAASIGGMATLIGTPPNATLVAYLREKDIHIGFGQWMIVGVPVSISLLAFTWWWLTRKKFALTGQGSDALIKGELDKLGPMSGAEKKVALVFVAAALAWMFQPLIATVLPSVNDTSIAMAAALSLFLIPVDARKRVFLMNWKYGSSLPWGILLLFGGGLSLANAIEASKLAEWIAVNLEVLQVLPVFLMMGIVVLVIVFLTEVTSNTATAATFLPLIGAVAIAQGIPPTVLAVPVALAASCAFMLPVATPPNAIVFSTGHMHISSMIRAGMALNVYSTIVLTLICYYLAIPVLTGKPEETQPPLEEPQQQQVLSPQSSENRTDIPQQLTALGDFPGGMKPGWAVGVQK